MKKIFNKIFILLILSFISIAPVYAQDFSGDQNSKTAPQETFKAKVVSVISEKNTVDQSGNSTLRQDLRLLGTSGSLKNKEFEINMIDDQDALVKNVYKVGDNVVVMLSTDELGHGKYFITDYVRTNVLLWLFIAFVVSILAVGRFKGFRALLSLLLTFLVMIKYIVPQILDGADPVIVTVIGSIGILVAIIYVTEGFNMKSNLSALSIFISLIFTVILSWTLVGAAKLSGLANEEAGFIVGLGTQTLNLQGILLAGIIIGTLGALDDIVISQVVTVEELNNADPYQTKAQIFKKAFNVGISHISAMTNTLFLAYAGAALPLLILFVSGKSAFTSWDVAINNEMVATEIIRTLAGTIGIVLTVPISTTAAIFWYKRKAAKN